jgi:hypothetical protein
MQEFADNKEFRAALYDIVRKTVSPGQVDAVLDNYAEALAIWLKFSPQPNGGYLYGRNNEFVFRVHEVGEHPGHGGAEGTIEPAHFALYVKASAPTLRALTEKLGKEVKNG